MKVIKSDTGLPFYEETFNKLTATQSDLILWQVAYEHEKRKIIPSKLSSFQMDSSKLYFEISSKELIHDDLPLYCYIENESLIFKADIQDLYETSISVNFPAEMKLMEESEVRLLKGSLDKEGSTLKIKSMSERSVRDRERLNDEFTLSLDDEDLLFADKRESPRARPQVDKWVKILKRGAGSNHLLYKLFDLSRGGLGVLSIQENEFVKGTEVLITGFDEFDLDDPLFGVVMSVRTVDETKTDFKVGIKFTDGQD